MLIIGIFVVDILLGLNKPNLRFKMNGSTPWEIAAVVISGDEGALCRCRGLDLLATDAWLKQTLKTKQIHEGLNRIERIMALDKQFARR
jgi:hypothetical protein